MDRYEFREWLEHHSALFENVSKAFAKLTDEGKKAKAAAWHSILRLETLEDCKAASEAILSEPGQKWTDNMPAMVRAKASVMRLRRQQQEDRRFVAETGVDGYRCPHCRDMGMLSVMVSNFPRQYQRHRQAYGEKADTMTCGVGCVCEQGMRTGAPVRFLPGVHLTEKASLPSTEFE